VVGQRIDKNRKWYLGNEKIDETDNYKYLGVYLSRNLKPTHHILKYLKENLENKLNGMVRILGKHGEFNRVEFGSALWTSVIRLSKKALIGSHPNSNNKALIGILIFVCKIIFAALYCILCSKLRCASDDGSHMVQPCAIHGRITEVHKALPNSTLLNSPCFPRILTIPF
jgi:hypothetical protein